MHSPVLSISFDWLLNESSSNIVITQPQEVVRGIIPIPKDIGVGEYEVWSLSDGASIYQAQYKFLAAATGRILPLAKVAATFKEPTLMIHTLKRGRVIHQDVLTEHDLVFGDGLDLFRHSEQISVIPLADTSHDIEMTSLIIGKSFLVDLIGVSLANQLLNTLGLLPLPKVSIKPVPRHVNQSLQNCLKPEYSPHLKKIWAQARILDFVSELTHYFCHTAKHDEGNKKKSQKIANSVHQYITHLEGKLPTIEALANQFGKSARSLNDDFQYEYGESIFSFIVNHRLNTAHEAIKTSSIPLKQLAARLGYAHVNHFSAAFKKKFGYPPGSLRKKIEER